MAESGKILTTGVKRSARRLKADQHEIASLSFFLKFVRERYRCVADFRSTNNVALCQIFEELFRRTSNAIELFFEDVERGQPEEDYDPRAELRVTALRDFECVFAELSGVPAEQHQPHLDFFFRVRAEIRNGANQAVGILSLRQVETTPLIQVTIENAAIAVIEQLFEVEEIYCQNIKLAFKPSDQGRFLMQSSE